MRPISICSLYFSLLVCVAATFAGDRDYQPKLEPASNDGKLAIDTFRIPEGCTVELVAAEPDVANPVAFCLDEKGQIYVCETFRQKKGVEDNRGHMDWLLDDLKAESVEDRRQYMLRNSPDKVAEWTSEHDRIRILMDDDNDGHYERSEVFADGFNDLVEGTGAGVLAFNGDVYYTCIPRIWRLRDEDQDATAEDREVIQNGFGVRFAFRGHDMHGLALGPDGRIYFSIGDRGYNLITEEGRVFKRPDTGAVFRCERDGSHLEEFAYGLRNPQELAFDAEGFLFTGDNNSDSGDKARWVYVAEGSDTGWRMYFQYLNDRGPWNRERMWYPQHADEQTTEVQPAYILPPIANLGDGPSGLVAYPGVGLEDRYQGHFFMADFRGQPANSGIRSFANEQDGAGYKLVDSHEYLWSTLVTDVDFGYDGRMYFTDWVNGWDGLQKGRIYRQTWNDEESRKVCDQTSELFKNGFSELTTKELADLLGHPDTRVRLRAQIEFAERNDVQPLQRILKSGKPTVVKRHAIWASWEIARKNSGSDLLATLVELCSSDDAQLVMQACRVLGDVGYQPAQQAIRECLNHEDPRVVFQAAIAAGKLGDQSAFSKLVEIAETKTEQDAALRHAIAFGMQGILKSVDTEDRLIELTNLAGSSPQARVCIVVALRNMHHSRLSEYLRDTDQSVRLEAARAVHDELIKGSLLDLASLPCDENSPDLFARRWINANYLMAGPNAVQRVADYAANQKVAKHLREQALDALLKWESGSEVDVVIGKYRPRPGKQLPILKSVVATRMASFLKGDQSIRKKGIELAALLKISDVVPELKKTVNSEDAAVGLRTSALNALTEVAPKESKELVVSLSKSSIAELRLTATSIAAKNSYPESVYMIERALEEGTVSEQQNAISLLPSLKKDISEELLKKLLNQLVEGELNPAIQLDVFLASEKLDQDSIKKLREQLVSKRDSATGVDKFSLCLQGGDAERGQTLFFGNAAASCRRCHLVNGNGGGVGPDLSEIGKQKDRTYLLESIVDPSAKIAKGFETVTIITIEGKIISGIVKEETDEQIKLVKPLGEVVTIPIDDIEDRAPGKSGMPADLPQQLSLSEIRDLVAYLATLQEKKVATDHGTEE